MTEKMEPKKRKSFEDNIEKNIEKWEKKTSANLAKWESKHVKYQRQIEKTLKEVKGFTEQAELLSRLCKDQIESFEDTMLHIMHNIKKNQFLYAHYPDEWAKNYLSIKDGLKDENEYMENIQ